MKENRNELTLLVSEALLFVTRIIFSAAAFIGVIYAIGFVVECFSGIITLSAGMFVIMTIAGLIIYNDYRPRRRHKSAKKYCEMSRTERYELCGR